MDDRGMRYYEFCLLIVVKLFLLIVKVVDEIIGVVVLYRIY